MLSSRCEKELDQVLLGRHLCLASSVRHGSAYTVGSKGHECCY